VLREAPYPDLWQNWGVFAEERMVGYAQVELFGTVCAGFSSIKYDPAALKLYSGYALIHTMNQYYLEVMGVQYVCNGARSISHETNMHEFLVRNFGFEKVYTNLNLYYRWPLGWIVALAYPFRGALGRAVPPLEKILRLEQFRRGPVKA